MTNQDGKVTYYPAPGLIRIWKKDGNTTRSLDDYIQSQFPYTQDQLGITPGQSVEFYIQDVRKISGLANIEVTTGTRSDSVLIRLANISLEMVSVDKDGNLTVDENGNPTNYKGLPSLSAPKIDGAADVTNLMIFPDGQIVGTVNVSGSVTSKACDMVDGPAGIIYDAAVVLNGTLPQKGSGEFTEDDPDAAFLPLTNSTASPTTHEPGPFRYKKNFTFSKASQYPLTEGINVLTILCKDPVTKLDGSLDIAFTLEVTEDANGINHVSIAESPEIFRQTTIGEINPYYLKVTGMDGLEDQLEHFKTQLTISGRKLKMFWDANKEMMLVEDPNYAGEALSTLMKPRERPDSPARDTFINEDDAAKRLQRLKTMAVGITDDILAFQKGYLDGLYDGGAEMVTGLGDVCVGAWGVGTNAMGYIGSTMSVGWYKLTGDEVAEASAKFNMNMFMEEQDPYIDGACKTANLLGEVYLYVEQNKQDALLALISTSIFEFDAGEAAKSRLTAAHDKVSFIAAEVFEMISEEFQGMSAYEIGHAYGRVSFEVISFIATLPAVELTIATKVAALTKLAEACELIQGVAKTRWIRVIGRIRTWLTEIATTKMCFVAGTLVATAHGMTPIEQIQAGDLVWSKPDSGGGIVELRPVIQTFVTHPHELWKLTYRSSKSGAEDETITGTAQHPFWTEEAQEFVPMGDLKSGMTLLLKDGQSAEVLRVEKTRGPPQAIHTTYNFEVEEFHTYFVGESGVWVHNTGRAPCERMFSLFDRILDFKNYKGNLGKGYDDIIRRLGKNLDQDLKSTFVEGILEDLPRLKDAGKVDSRIVAFATEDGIFKPAEAFLGSRFELLSGRKITGRAPFTHDPVTGNQLPGADFIDNLGSIWDGVGPLPKSAWTTQSRLDGFFAQITRHIDIAEKGNPIVDLAGLPDSLKQRALNLVKTRLSNPNSIDVGIELLLDNGKQIILLGD